MDIYKNTSKSQQDFRFDYCNLFIKDDVKFGYFTKYL